MAEWTTSYINDLPDSAFACIQGDQRLYPHHDASGAVDLPHLRAALSRVGDPNNDQCGKGHLEAHAKAELGQGKAWLPIKAGPLEDEDAFWKGRIPRRLLAIPFGGPIPSAKSARGVDLDGEFFSERTDIFGPYKALKQTRERLVDWHHSLVPASAAYGDPTGRMTGVVLGKAVLDAEPDEDGWWVDFWVRAGERRVALVRRVAERAQIFGSSQPMGQTAKADTGEITLWPFALETLSTAPQNTASVMNAKALLDDADQAGIAISDQMRSLLADMHSLGSSLGDPSSVGDQPAKAGRELSGANEAELVSALEALSGGYDRLKALLDRIKARYAPEAE